MNRRILFVSSAVVLTGGLLLAGAPAAVAQSGMPGTPQGATNSSQTLAERNLAGALLSNIRAETKFSKLALKNSSDEQVKKLARQVISENGKLAAQLVTLISGDSAVNTEVNNFGHLSSHARETERDLKKLRGTAFDKSYSNAMSLYSRNERTMIRDHSTLLALSRPRTRRLISRIEASSEGKSQQLHQVAG